MPLKRQPDADIARVCGNCERRFTKGGWIESAIRERLGDWPEPLFHDVAMSGYRLARLKEAGAVFAYPDGLGLYEWKALECLTIARNEVDARESREREEKPETKTMDREASKAALKGIFGGS